jgi:rare lipoprotein A
LGAGPTSAPAPKSIAAASEGDATAATAAADGLALPSIPQGNGFWIQLGAFRQREGAESFQRRVAAELDWLIERLAVFDDVSLFRLQAGPYASRDEARSAAERIRSALQLVPVVLERR